METQCQHHVSMAKDCFDCPRLSIGMERLTEAIAGWDRKTVRWAVRGDGPVGKDAARTLAGDIFDALIGITK